MEEKKRKGYKTQEQQNEANKRYRATEEGKEKTKHSTYKSRARVFINEMATLEELEELEILIKNKKMEVLKMSRLEERIIRGLSFIKESGEYLVEIESYKIVGDSEDMIDSFKCGYIDKEDLEELKSFVENQTEVLKGDFPKKVNVIKETDDGYDTIDVFYPKLRK
jgi:hypothetical protein|nr:MAG TPA: hypothetical protein [Caudoviricetes sp.]